MQKRSGSGDASEKRAHRKADAVRYGGGYKNVAEAVTLPKNVLIGRLTPSATAEDAKT